MGKNKRFTSIIFIILTFGKYILLTVLFIYISNFQDETNSISAYPAALTQGKPLEYTEALTPTPTTIDYSKDQQESTDSDLSNVLSQSHSDQRLL